MMRIKLKNILPRRFRYWHRSRKTWRDHCEATRQRHQVVERLMADANLRQIDHNHIQHVLFIIVDCLRRDHVSQYGYSRKTTPFFDTLAKQGCLFHDSISPSSWTYPVVASMLSGLYPHRHGGIFQQDLRDIRDGVMPQKVRDDVLFLPEILGNFGYATYIGSVLAPVDLAVKGRFHHGLFYRVRNAAFVFRQYLRWLHKHRTRKTFGYLQLGDLHTRIRVKDPYRSAFGEIPDIPLLERWDYHGCFNPDDFDFKRYRENRIKLYDAALFYVDDQIRECFRYLEKLKVLDNVLIVITADHGEELWDHRLVEKKHFFDPRGWYGVGHGHHLWQEIVTVPLLLWGRNVSARKVYHRVSLVDLMPTVLQLCGIEELGTLPCDGQSLFDTSDERAILAEDVALGYEKKAVFEGRYKLYYSEGDGIRWVFNLENDPYEKAPLDLPEVAGYLQGLIPKTEHNKEGEKPLSVDEEMRKRLRFLGYVE